MKHLHKKFKEDQHLYIHSMGKKYRVVAIFTNVEDANKHMSRNDSHGVIASFPVNDEREFIFLADIYDKGVKCQ